MTVEAIVAGVHLRYAGVRQRPQQLLSRLAGRVPVLYVEEPFLARDDRDAFERTGMLDVLRPLRTSLDASAVDARTCAAARAWAGDRRTVVWLETPMMLALADAFAGAPVVYDCMDELSAFAFAPPDMKAREHALLERAALVFAGGRTLYDARRALGAKVRCYPSGVEPEHFARALTVEPHPLFRHLPRPRFAYVGVIDERIDQDVLRALGACDAQTVMIGPVVKIDPAVLPRRPNVHFTGQVDYAALPSFLAGVDVALMPFARNAATANISPTKTPEYLAAGRPVVSTPIDDVVTAYGDVVTVADSPAAFAAACVRLASAPDPARVARGRSRAREASWDAIAEAMWRDLSALERAPA